MTLMDAVETGQGLAWQWDGDPLKEGDPDWVAEATEPVVAVLIGATVVGIFVWTVRGKQRAKRGDWIVKAPNGDVALLTPDLFIALRARQQ